MRALVPALAAALALAGCVAPPNAIDGPASTAPFVDPIVDEHDHADPAEHALSTPSMHLIGHDMLGEDGTAFSYIGEIDAFEDLVVVQVIGRGSTPGFVLVNVTDPADPAVVGRANWTGAYVVDVKFSPDGRYVLAASQNRPSPAGLADNPLLGASTQGIVVFDVADPAAPTAVGGAVVPGTGCHMLSVKEIAGTVWVFCVGESIYLFSMDNVETGALTPAGQYAPQGTTGIMEWAAGAEPLPGPAPHDITVVEDPVDGTWTMFASYWDLGVRIVDVTDPRTPREIGAWAGEGASRYEGNIHSAMPIVIDGTRYVVTAPELLADTVPAVYVLDATDYGAMTLAAEWLPPGEHPTQGLLLTTHQFQLVDGRMYMAYNHAGLWVLDLRAILAGGFADDPARPEVLGYYLPHEDVPLYDPEAAAVPNTWDVVVKDGYIYASDRYTGLYVLHHAPDAMGDPALTSFA